MGTERVPEFTVGSGVWRRFDPQGKVKMLEYDEQKTLLNIRQADTDDLLDRITAYRAGMEPSAIGMIEQELHRRGVTDAQIAERTEAYKGECLFHADGTAKKCALCRKPAVTETMGWHKLFSILPLFPQPMCYCKDHSKSRVS
jgi:hypothetical protein